MAMKPRRRKRPSTQGQAVATLDPTTTIFSSDLLTPDEERELLNTFWDCKTDLVNLIVRHFRSLRQHKPPLNEPWPMAQFIRDHCTDEARKVPAIRHVHDH